jgi:hypothetical protein
MAAVAEPSFGRIQPGERHHALYRQHLQRAIDEPFAVFVPT